MEVTHQQNLGCSAPFKFTAKQYWFCNKWEKKFESSKTKVELSNYDSAALNSGADLNLIFLVAAQMNEVKELVPAWDS